MLLISVLLYLAIASQPVPANSLSNSMQGEANISSQETGTVFIIAVQTDNAVKNELDTIFKQVHDMIRSSGLTVKEFAPLHQEQRHPSTDWAFGEKTGRLYFEIVFPDYDTLLEAESLITNALDEADSLKISKRDYSILRIALTSETEESIRSEAVEKTLKALNNRIDRLQIKGAEIDYFDRTAASRRLVVKIPVTAGIYEIRSRLFTTGRLEFRLIVYDEKGSPVTASSRSELENKIQGKPPIGVAIVPEYESITVAPEMPEDVAVRWYLTYLDAPISGHHVASATATHDAFGNASVGFRMTAEGADRLRRLTRANIGKQLAIILDGRCLAAPVIQSEIAEGGIISGNFTERMTERLAWLLKIGALPVPVKIESEETN